MAGEGDIFSNTQEVSAVAYDLEENALRRQNEIENGPPNGRGIAEARGTYAALITDIDDLVGRLDGLGTDVEHACRTAVLAAGGLSTSSGRIRAVNQHGNAGLEEAAKLLDVAEDTEVNAAANLRGAQTTVPEHIAVLRGLQEALKLDATRVQAASTDNEDAKVLTHKAKARLDSYVAIQNANPA